MSNEKVTEPIRYRTLKSLDADGQIRGLIRTTREDGEFCQRRIVDLKAVSFDNLIDYLLLLYQHAQRAPDYLFLSEQDYWNLRKEIGMRITWYVGSEWTNQHGQIVKFPSPVSSEPMHLATLPNLKEGEIMVMYAYE